MTYSNGALPNAGQSAEPYCLPKKRLPAFVSMAIPMLAVLSGVMLLFAVPNIIEGSDWLSYAKGFVLAASATVVAYGVNKLAIERGAPLATTGYIGAGIVSIASMLAVGAGLFAATYSGLVFKDAAELQLQEHGTRLNEFVADRSSAAAQAGRVNPAIRAIVGDLDQKTQCEINESCISGRGNGGRGPVARVVEEYAGRARSIGVEVTAGDIARQQIITRLNGEIAEYQAILGNGESSIWDRRNKLQSVDAKIRQETGELGEAVPLALLLAYASELKAGVSISGHPEAEARLNGILLRHGQSLAAVIDGIDGKAASSSMSAPGFPPRTGVSDTFQYFGHFLPIAAITAVVELVFPLVLWAYTFWTLRWDIYKRQWPVTVPRPDDDDNPSWPEGRNSPPIGEPVSARDPRPSNTNPIHFNGVRRSGFAPKHRHRREPN